MLKVKLAKTAGFCWGVKRAMDIAIDVSEKVRGTLYTYGPLIHNPQVIEMLESKDIKVLNDFEKSGVSDLVIRTHGITPEKRREIKAKGFKINDATCPLVMKVQSLIKRHARKGHSTIIVGDKNHAEVEGLLGFAEGRGFVIGTLAEIDSLPSLEKVSVVAQTTFDKNLYEQITKRLLKYFPSSQIFKTTCDATDQRQTEVINLAKTVDAMIVVGGKNSANTVRLAQICRDSGTPTFLVETEEEINERHLSGFRSIGVSAGASTPNWMLNRVVEKVESIKMRKLSRVFQTSLFLGRFFIFSNLYVAIGGGILAYSVCQLQNLTPDINYFYTAFFYFLSMYMLNNFSDREALGYNNPVKNNFYEKYKYLFLITGMLSPAASLTASFNLGVLPSKAVFASLLFGILYSVKIIPRDKAFTRYWRLKDIPASKDLFIALAWATITVLVPFLSQESTGSLVPFSIAFLFVFTIVYTRCLLFDVRDIQGDKLIGRETIPIIMGKEKTKLYLVIILILAACALFASGWFNLVPTLSYFLLISIGYCAFYLFLYHNRIISQGISCDAVVDAQFYIIGLITLVWVYSFAP